jgi:hypothetical protein
MSNAVPTYVTVPINTSDAGATNVLQFQFTYPINPSTGGITAGASIAGTLTTVVCEGAVLVDPTSGNAYQAMTSDQADDLIRLMRELIGVMKSLKEEFS